MSTNLDMPDEGQPNIPPPVAAGLPQTLPNGFDPNTGYPPGGYVDTRRVRRGELLDPDYHPQG